MTMGSEETEQNNLKYALKLPQSTRERTQQPAGSQVVPGNVVKWEENLVANLIHIHRRKLLRNPTPSSGPRHTETSSN